MPMGLATAFCIACLAGGIFFLPVGIKNKKRGYIILGICSFLIFAVIFVYFAAVLLLLGGID